MNTLLLAPHNDDETLFAGFLVMRFQPKVHIVFKSSKQQRVGISAAERETETQYALLHLGTNSTAPFTWHQGDLPDTMDDRDVRRRLLPLLELAAGEYDHVFAPAREEDGHEQHNAVADCAIDAFGEDKVTQYLTYRRSFPRTRSAWEIPFEPSWPVAKLRAMSCYSTQITLSDTAPWFVDSTLREYLAHPPKVPWPAPPGTRAVVPLEHHERAAYL